MTGLLEKLRCQKWTSDYKEGFQDLSTLMSTLMSTQEALVKLARKWRSQERRFRRESGRRERNKELDFSTL